MGVIESELLGSLTVSRSFKLNAYVAAIPTHVFQVITDRRNLPASKDTE